ncbi:glycosyltransferase family 61 protein [Acetobacteraceae bacterium KSS8]|uniref:Glycosyltransferase family 61 protein n=1 Tax=Endosaccharibacter trunci TaxID=2812733 RepID=A0ABT1W8U4_9PROT|nr:glycosyltransferase family 61 protein [Acetobacteraceae bacterium KSS8]
MTSSAAIPLNLPDPAELVARPTVTELQRNQLRHFRNPSLNLDLSTQGVRFDFQSALDVHATYVGRYTDQYVFGFHHLHALISRDGEFNCQEILNYRGRLENYLGHPPDERFVVPDIGRVGDGYNVSFERLTDDAVIPLDGPVFLGSPIEPANWGMWLLNGLANAKSFVSAGQPGRFLCYAPSSWQQNLLRFMGVDADRLIDQKPWQTYFCREIALHQYSMVDLVPDESAMAMFRNIVGRCVDKSRPNTPSRIFISRRSVTAQSGGSYRALQNEDALIEALSRYGFVVVEPELLSFEEQVRVFSNARFIVGLGGAAMFNAVFANPGTNLISIESTSVFALNHARLFASLKLNYGFIFGEQDASAGNYPHNPWTVDVQRAIQAIASFG